MRQNVLGSAMPKASWCPRFAPAKAKKADRPAVERIDGGPTVSWMPSWRGIHRIIPLKHYFHIDMAYILEADPDVLTWDTEVEPVRYLDGAVEKVFVPSILARTRKGIRLIRLHHSANHSNDNRRPPSVKAVPRPVPGMTFEVYSRRDLENHPKLKQSRAIVFHRSREWRKHLPVLLANTNALRPAANLGELQALLGPKEDDWYDLLSLVAQGYVEVDMGVPLGPLTPVIACRTKGYRDE